MIFRKKLTGTVWLAQLLAAALFSMAAAQSAAQGDASPVPSGIGQEIEFAGYIGDRSRLPQFEQLYGKFFSDDATIFSERRVASAIVVYIGPEVVLDGQFVKPPTYDIPESQLRALEALEYNDGECNLFPLYFKQPEEIIVLLVDDSETPTYHESAICILRTFALALGANDEELAAEDEHSLTELVTSLIGG